MKKAALKTPFIKYALYSMLGGSIAGLLLGLIGLVLTVFEVPEIYKLVLVAMLVIIGFISGVYWSLILYSIERGEDFRL
ncbi:hypothetical protein SDC9_42703 [bioreactor metagenome]|uniref:Uncharacterized protein n=1 Tax=bioreactor metagenome TaxID=1076179 RepID=A0A644VYM3_9ZZZZ|nr:hypothetical protein [Dehalococcoides mccartyi]